MGFVKQYIFLVLAGGLVWSSTPYRLEYPTYFGNRIYMPDDNPLTVEGIALGRRLFYEKRLSRNNTVSCATCHQQSRAFTDGRAFSLGFDGVPTRRSAMSLVNLLWVRNFFWDGRAEGLEAQAKTPLTEPHEMGETMDNIVAKLKGYDSLFNAAFGSGGVTGERVVKSLAQFERTLISADSRYDRYIKGTGSLSVSEMNGLRLFFGRAVCSNCHGGPKTFNETYHNNGLDKVIRDSGRMAVTGMAYDRGRFRVVTLRNIALTAPYMHDGRFKTLEEVVDHYSEHLKASETLSPTLRDTAGVPVKLQLSEREKADIAAFLRTLTDSAFVTDPRFSDPGNIKVN